MDEANVNPLLVILLYILRCMVPLGIMLGISYLLRRFGVINAPPPPPKNWNGDENEDDASQGGMTHD